MTKRNHIKILWTVAFILCIVLIICSGILANANEYAANANEYTDKYTDLAEEVGTVKEYWCDELTTEILLNRGTDVVIEKIIGICVDGEGNGQIVNPADPAYNYISYKSVNGVHTGDVVLTLCIYQPCSAGEDDIVQRFDYIIGK